MNIPEKKDDWFPAIDDMTKAFFNEYKLIPNKSQAWAQLWDTPPGGYRITNGTDKLV
ncbi:MAG: hypothetical protein Q7U57_00260 [Methylovulum sp.]|nr:hypothetical protein [Methylovulum sp.]